MIALDRGDGHVYDVSNLMGPVRFPLSIHTAVDINNLRIGDELSYETDEVIWTGTVVEFSCNRIEAVTLRVPDKWAPTGYINMRFSDGDVSRLWVKRRHPFTVAEEENAKSHGSKLYEEAAALCDAERERRDLEVIGPLIEWHTIGDGIGTCEESIRRRALRRQRFEARFLRALPKPRPHENESDYAARTGLPQPRSFGSRDEWITFVRAEMDAVAEGRPVE